MPRITSDQHLQDQDHFSKETTMYTSTETLQAEAGYRRNQIARDFRATRTARPRGRGEPAARRRWQLHLHLRHA